MAKKKTVTARQAVRTLADVSGVPLNEVDRAIVLGQLAEFLAKSSRVGTNVAFKGATVMRLVENSPRLSKDLDSSLVVHTGRKITLEDVQAALSTPEAKRIVKRIDPKGARSGTNGLRVDLIVCHPKSGVDEVTVSFSVNWGEPILLPTVIEEVDVEGNLVKLRVMARPERVAEKVRTFLNRAEDRDAFDLYLYATKMTKADWASLPELVGKKLEADPEAPQGAQARVVFDEQTDARAKAWDPRRSSLRLMNADVPDWDAVKTVLDRFREVLPDGPDPGA